MKIAALSMLVCLGMALTAYQTPISNDSPSHFRWSERAASELDYQHMLRNATEISPDERKALLHDVVGSLKQIYAKDPDADRISNRKLRELAGDTRIRLVDLTGLGSRDLIAQANGLGPCGGTGNCVIWFFELTQQGPRLLLDSSKSGGAFEVVTIRPWSTNGYKDIVLGAHESASERILVWYKYSNGNYKMSSCYNLSTTNGLQLLNSPQILEIRCR
jgi:hypothetical protein